jgi:hypothetical protein
MTRSIILSIAVVSLSLGQSSDGASQWNIIRAVNAGHRIRVETSAVKYSGGFAGLSDSAIMLQSEKGQVSVPRAEVLRVYSQSRSNRLRNTLIGAAIGAAVGITTYGTLGALLRNEGADNTGVLVAAPVTVGTAVGAILPAGGMKKIYDAKEEGSR